MLNSLIKYVRIVIYTDVLGAGFMSRLNKMAKIFQRSSNVSTIKSKSAYTLAEVVIVMMVIAVIVGVSIKITKAKLDHITSYTYYTAYSTLRNVSGQMLSDFKPTDTDYTDTAHLLPQTLLSLFLPQQKAQADTPEDCENQPSQEDIDAQYRETGDEWSGYPECTYKPTCDTDGYQWDPLALRCVPEPSTVPRKGSNFCEKFVSYSNTKSNSPECNGDAVGENVTDFSALAADMILRNGMRLYNVRQDPAEIEILAGNTQGGRYEGVDNINTYGYTVYVDIDGEKGASTLWEDVYKFYITMSGKVIPAYNEARVAEITGGNSRNHLMTSVMRETISNGPRTITWLRKSVTFQEGACASGYVQGTYCNGIARLPECSDAINLCVMKYISPAKFF